MLITACVVDEFGMAPYWLSPIFLSIAGFKCSSTTNSSATFDRTGVFVWGLAQCLLTSKMAVVDIPQRMSLEYQ